MSGATRFQHLAAIHRDAERRLMLAVRRRARSMSLDGEIRWMCPECRALIRGRWWRASDHAVAFHPSWGRAFESILRAREDAMVDERIRRDEEERVRKHAAWVEERNAYHAALAREPVDVVWLPPNYRGRVHR